MTKALIVRGREVLPAGKPTMREIIEGLTTLCGALTIECPQASFLRQGWTVSFHCAGSYISASADTLPRALIKAAAHVRAARWEP